MNNNIKKGYLNLIYNWNQRLIDEQNSLLSIKNKYPIYNNIDIIFESTFFTKIDDVFEDWLVKQFEDLRKEIINQYSINGLVDKEKYIKISEVLMNICTIPVHYSNIKADDELYQKFNQYINNIFDIQDIKNFFYYTYINNISYKENLNTRNKWTILTRWLKDEFKK